MFPNPCGGTRLSPMVGLNELEVQGNISYGWALQNEGTRNTLDRLSGQRRSTIYGWALQAAVHEKI